MKEKFDRFQKYNQPETLGSLAAKYKVSTKTLKKWIKPIENQLNLDNHRIFTPAELKMIIEFLGEYSI
jgi:hypothetical protein